MTPRRRTHRRRGTVYVVVLTSAMLVAVISVSAVLSMRVRNEQLQGGNDLIAARLHARSAIEMGLHAITATSDWRDRFDTGAWFANEPLGTGSFTLSADDPADGDLATGICDSVELTATGVQGHSRATLRVTLRADAVDHDPHYDYVMEIEPFAYWRLGDVDTTVAYEQTGHFPGVYKNGVTLDEPVSTRCDTAASLDGSNDFVEIPHDDTMLLNSGGVSLWFNSRNIWANQGLFAKDSSGNDTGGHFYIRLDGGRIQCRIQDDDEDSYYVRSSTLQSNRWYHVVVLFGEWGFYLFINGQYVDYEDYFGGWGTSSGDIGNYEPITIGVNQNKTEDRSSEGWTEPFYGSIDEVAVFDTLFWEDEINGLYNTGVEEPPHTMSIVPGSWERVVD